MLFYRTLLLFQLFVGFVHADSFSAAYSPSMDALQTILDKTAGEDKFSGAVLVARNGEILFEKAYGFACRRFQVPNNLDTKFNLASVGKLFTSLAIAQLIQQNKLTVHDTVDKYLTDWLPSDIARQITIRDLLIHTSGLGSFFDNRDFQLGDLSGFYLAVRDYRPLLANEKLLFKPGTSQVYSNTAYLILGAIIEKVSGEDYFHYIQRHIFDPAGMKSSGFFEMDELVPNLAVGFSYAEKNGQKRWRNNLFDNVLKGNPAGGSYSTVRDLLAFSQALTEHKLLNETYTQLYLSGETAQPNVKVKYFRRPFVSQGQTYNVLYTEHGAAGGPWNEFGLEIYGTDPLRVGHNGGGLPGISDDMVIYPDVGYVYISLSNATGEGIFNPQSTLEKAIADTLPKTSARRK